MGKRLNPALISLGALALLGILALFITPALADGVDAGDLEVVASGLDQPRGLNFGPDGALYVAEAGRGGKGSPIALVKTSCVTGTLLNQTPNLEASFVAFPDN